MSSISFNTPYLGALADHSVRTPAKRSPTSQHQDAVPSVTEDLRAAVNGDTHHQSNNAYGQLKSLLPSGKEYRADNLAKMITSPTPSDKPFISLRAVELTIPKDIERKGDVNGLSSSGIRPTWIENHGSLIGLNGAGIKLGGNQNDEVDNSGLIKGKTVALDMGDGNDTLMVRSGAQFEGLVDGGKGTNGAYLDDLAGGTFNGATRMNLWVAHGDWTLTGPIENSKKNQVYSGATLTNLSSISGQMTVEQGATYSGGTVADLDVKGTLRLNPATRVDNDLHMHADSTLTFAPDTDKTLSVGNTVTLSGARLNIQVKDENAVPERPIRLINAERINGKFAGITTNLKNVTPIITYKSHDVFVTFERSKPALS